METKVLCAVLFITVLAVQDSLVFGLDPVVNYVEFGTLQSKAVPTCNTTKIQPNTNVVLPTKTFCNINAALNNCTLNMTGYCDLTYTVTVFGGILMPPTTKSVSQSSCTTDTNNSSNVICPGNISMSPTTSQIKFKSVTAKFSCVNYNPPAASTPVNNVGVDVINGTCTP